MLDFKTTAELKRAPRALALILVLVFVVSLPASTRAFNVRQLGQEVKEAEAQGYKVTVKEEPCDFLKWPKGCPTKVVKVTLVKEGKGEEGRGVLDVKWDERKTWNLLFLVNDTELLELIAVDGVREEKAPVAGTWKPIEKLSQLPPVLKLGVAPPAPKDKKQ